MLLTDDFNRGSLGTVAPNGQPYEATNVEIVGNELNPIDSSLNASLLYRTFQPDCSVSLTFGTAGSGGIFARQTDATHRISALYNSSAGTVSLTYIAPTGSAGWLIFTGMSFAAGDVLSLDMADNVYTLRKNGTVLGTYTDTARHYTDVSTHGVFTSATYATTINSFTVDGIDNPPARLHAHAGTAESDRTVTPTHAAIHAGSVERHLLFDHFNRATLGTVAETGQPYTGAAGWEINANRLRALTTGTNFLTADVGATEYRVSVKIPAAVYGHGAGIVFRWSDATNYMGLATRPDANQIFCHKVEGGSLAFHCTWVVGAFDPTGKTLEVVLHDDNTFDVYYDGANLGPPSSGTNTTTLNVGSTQVGLFSIDHISEFDDLIVDGIGVITDPTHAHIHPGVVAATSAAVAAAHIEIHAGTASTGLPVEARTFALAGAIRGPVAYGPRITTDTPPVPLAVRLYHADDLTAEVATLTSSHSRRWMDQLNEPGSGSVVLQNDDDTLADVGIGDVIRFEIDGYAAFAAIVRELNSATIDPSEESGQTTTLTGPGVLAMLDGATVYPARGIGSMPIQEDRVFNWAAVDFDDTAWGTALELMSVADAQTGGWPFQPMGAGFPPAGASMIWAPGTTELSAPGGECYFRKTFTAGAAGRILFYVLVDNYGEVYLDGQVIKTVEAADGFTTVTTVAVDVSSGEHTIAARAVNFTGDGEDPGINPPGALAIAVYDTDTNNVPLNPFPLVATDGTWKIVAYPPSPPGMTPGEVIRHVVQEAQGRGGLPGLSLNFTDEVDADGVPWPEVGDIATRVGTDVLTFVRELTATYVDVWMEPGGWRLWAWVRDGRGRDTDVDLHAPTDPLAPLSGNLRALTHRVVL